MLPVDGRGAPRASTRSCPAAMGRGCVRGLRVCAGMRSGPRTGQDYCRWRRIGRFIPHLHCSCADVVEDIRDEGSRGLGPRCLREPARVARSARLALAGPRRVRGIPRVAWCSRGCRWARGVSRAASYGPRRGRVVRASTSCTCPSSMHVEMAACMQQPLSTVCFDFSPRVSLRPTLLAAWHVGSGQDADIYIDAWALCTDAASSPGQ
mmetsp:Transcript_43494/g.114645  ORF Transcript_43494/g.114645 Transcript_43494/m.114645 type:complete len:208 (+) Transcript_43494:1096-1719(+)